LKTKKKFFSAAYKISKQEDIDSLYTDWAHTYDDELKEMGYQSPIRCASALAKFVSLETPVLDFGCGTGLSGQAFKRVGFQTIFGTEINTNMKEIAQKKGIYNEFYHTDKDIPFPVNAQFDGICAVGVISSGAGPPSLLQQSLNSLNKDGFICFSYNDHTLSVSAYMDALIDVKKSGHFKEVFCAYGDHLPTKGLGSTVYVFQKQKS
jgi:predicted TPR repeat methyltransferase